MLTTLDPELREGFTEHARLFSGLVDQMIDDGSEPHQDFFDPLDVGPELLPLLPEGPVPDGLEELLAAPTLDRAVDVLADYPELISRSGGILRQSSGSPRIMATTCRANHVQKLIHTYTSPREETHLKRIRWIVFERPSLGDPEAPPPEI